MKKISILGSTGSIGQSTLEIISRHPDKFQVVGLAARVNTRLLESQIISYRPSAVAVFDKSAASELKKKDLPVKISSGIEGLIEVSTLNEADMVVSAITGSDGMLPTFEAIKAGKDIALANKEALVMAGPLIMDEALKRGVTLIPVDSEHSAIFQCLNGRRVEEVQKLILTASGGPFIRLSASDLKTVTPEEALKHPNWSMGKKVTIDSATLMNKGLEVIEAHYLFGIPAERIEVILHPQSIVHSMVEFIDGSILAQMSVPDMKGPICYALSYPRRLDKVLPPLNLLKVRGLTFEKPDNEKFPCLSLAYKALKVGGTMPSVLNAANEVAVEAFLNKKISLKDIATVIADTMDSHNPEKCVNIKNILKAAEQAKEKAKEILEVLK
ncbi:MAG TPA: 1-deoxy-D-xylulose-5-phosphate reductoisomerase [Nitrospiraceae bacterium]|nr:1-deoxy-D-xylulose-5-phosphate reductoisomerase [Nitrospiraceae bacterium]